MPSCRTLSARWSLLGWTLELLTHPDATHARRDDRGVRPIHHDQRDDVTPTSKRHQCARDVPSGPWPPPSPLCRGRRTRFVPPARAESRAENQAWTRVSHIRMPFPVKRWEFKRFFAFPVRIGVFEHDGGWFWTTGVTIFGPYGGWRPALTSARLLRGNLPSNMDTTEDPMSTIPDPDNRTPPTNKVVLQ